MSNFENVQIPSAVVIVSKTLKLQNNVGQKAFYSLVQDMFETFLLRQIFTHFLQDFFQITCALSGH